MDLNVKCKNYNTFGKSLEGDPQDLVLAQFLNLILNSK